MNGQDFCQCGAAMVQSNAKDPALDLATTRASLIESRVGGRHEGTWMHRIVAVDYARWLCRFL